RKDKPQNGIVLVKVFDCAVVSANVGFTYIGVFKQIFAAKTGREIVGKDRQCGQTGGHRDKTQKRSVSKRLHWVWSIIDPYPFGTGLSLWKSLSSWRIRNQAAPHHEANPTRRPRSYRHARPE